MKDKAELTKEHIVGYFPYELKIYSLYDGEEYYEETITELREKEVLTSLRNGYYYKNIKPILHPLSDLTKPMVHNGEKFVPIVKIYDCYEKDGGYKVINLSETKEKYLVTFKWKEWIKTGDPEVEIRRIFKDIKDNPYWIVQKLIEWKFDVFGLIEKGLAINVNTLKDNPYK